MNAEEVVKLKVQYEGGGTGRHEDYDTTLAATHGNYYDRVMQSTWKKWQGIIYEPSSNVTDKRQVHIVLNLLNPIVEAKRALWSVVPEVRVPYKSFDDADTAMSDKLETVYRALWKENRIGEKLGDGGWYAALLGTAIFCVYPDFVSERPRIVVRSPYGFYGTTANIEQDGTEWKQVVFVTKMLGRQANMMWPEKTKGQFSPNDSVDIIEYWDEEEKQTVIQQGMVVVDGPVPNKLKKVPVVSIPNIAQPGQWWGKSDVIDAIPIINELNKRFNVENQAFSDQAGAPWEAINATDGTEPDDITLDPDGINMFNAGGGLKKSATGGLPWQIYQSNTQLRQYIDSVTDFPEVMRSMFGGSNISGKAINNMMGPIQARMELRQRYLYPRLEILNKYMLETWATNFGGKPMTLYGSIEGERYNLEIDPEEFAGYYENEVFLDSSAYFDVQSKVVLGLQMIAAEGCSIKTFIQKLNPFTDDYTAEIEQIRKEREERIQAAMTAQMIAQNAMMQQPEVGMPGQDARALQGGNQNMPSPMQPPPGVSPDLLESGLQAAGMVPTNEVEPQGIESILSGPLGAGGEMTPMSSGGLNRLTAVADIIRSTPKVQGRVFLSGSILEGEEGPEGIEIWFTDMVDWGTVRTHAYKSDPTLKDKFNPQQGIPNIPFLEVTPGTEGYDPQEPGALKEEGLEAIPAEMGSPDMGSMMGGPSGPAMMPPPEIGGV